MVSSSLISSQIDKRNLSENSLLFPDDDLKNSMRPRRLSVGVVFRCNSEYATLLDDVQKLLCSTDLSLVEADDVDVTFFVLSDLQEVAVVEQIIELSAVDLVEGNCYLLRTVLGEFEVPEDFLCSEVVNTWHSLRDVSLHGVGLARAGLSVGEA